MLRPCWAVGLDMLTLLLFAWGMISFAVSAQAMSPAGSMEAMTACEDPAYHNDGCIPPRYETCTNGGVQADFRRCMVDLMETWPGGLGRRIVQAHDRYCRALAAAVGPFSFHGQTTCADFQLSFLSFHCDERGFSRATPGQNCLAELERDLAFWLSEARPIRAASRVVPQPSPPRPPATATTVNPSPSLQVPFGTMPASLGTVEISARDVFAGSRASVWVLRAMTPQGVASQGSAVAVTPRHLLTTCHVVAGTNSAEITQGSARRPVSVVLRDQASDRCVLEVGEPVLRPIRAVRPFRQVEVGERVYTVGAPAGLELTLGDGLVSSLHPSPRLPIIQTSAPMSPGSSGGALLDARGNLIGIVAFQVRNGQSLGFALAADSFWTIR